MPGEIASGAVSWPLYRSLPAVVPSVPTPKYVAVGVPTVHAPNVIAAALATCVGAVADFVQPAHERATATRAYVVNAISLVVWSPVSPGSAVCRLTYRLPAAPEGCRPDVSPIPAVAVLLKTSRSRSDSQV